MSDDQQDVYLLLGRLDGKMDLIIREQNQIDSLITKNEERIRVLEKDRAVVYGAATVLAFIGSGLMWIVSYLIKGS
jgi:hypothetical protein|tara:strand:+ start:48 stop:275 length:228 start_codon:yes stop_codon:yes gene_type:complete